MTQALTLHQNQPLAQADWSVIREQATVLVKGGFLPEAIRTPEQAISIILLGRELDIPAWAALNNINVIKGKPTVSPQLMLALIERSQLAEQIAIAGDDDQAVVTMQRRGRGPHTARFTMADAKRLGLAAKQNYQQQPGVMLQWRAVAACARVVFPDIVLGLYTPEEMGAEVSFTESGEMVVEPFTSPEIVEADVVPFEEVEPEYALDPHRVVAYTQLLRRAISANHAATMANRPEPFELAAWELQPSTSPAQLETMGTSLKARLKEVEAASVLS
jgi:hypothetical protein